MAASSTDCDIVVTRLSVQMKPILTTIHYAVNSLYPPYGIEFSYGYHKHLTIQFQIHGDNMWIIDEVRFFIREMDYRRVPGSMDTFEWYEVPVWIYLGSTQRDIRMSTKGDEGATYFSFLF